MSLLFLYKLIFNCSGSPKNVFLEAEIDGLVVSSIETREGNSHADSITDLVLKPHTGQKITFSCLELGDVKLTNPVPEISFLKNGVAVTDSVSSFPSNSITVIAKTDVTYKCEVKNKMGNSLSNSIRLEVQRKCLSIPDSFCIKILIICFLY